MGQNFSDVCRTLAEYHCPRYEELPHIALYKDQVVSVLNEAVGPFYPQGETPVTATMVNNYVKMKLLAPPEKKKYSTGQIAYLYVIFLLKQVLRHWGNCGAAAHAAAQIRGALCIRPFL